MLSQYKTIQKKINQEMSNLETQKMFQGNFPLMQSEVKEKLDLNQSLKQADKYGHKLNKQHLPNAANTTVVQSKKEQNKPIQCYRPTSELFEQDSLDRQLESIFGPYTPLSHSTSTVSEPGQVHSDLSQSQPTTAPPRVSSRNPNAIPLETTPTTQQVPPPRVSSRNPNAIPLETTPTPEPVPPTPSSTPLATTPTNPQQVPPAPGSTPLETTLSAGVGVPPSKLKKIKPKEYIPLVSSNKAATNTATAGASTATLAGASGANTALQNTNALGITGQPIISAATGATIGGPIAIAGALRSGRQAYRAHDRSKIALEYAKDHAAESSVDDHTEQGNASGSSTDDPDARLGKIAQYTADKQGTRAKKLGLSTAAGGASGALLLAAAATAAAPPLLIPAAVLGAASALPSAYGVAKNRYKKREGTLGIHRQVNATDLYDQAKKGHAESINFMKEVGVLNSGTRPSPEAEGYYEDDLKNPLKRDDIIRYIMQKMRS
jgi:hypothetical protein